MKFKKKLAASAITFSLCLSAAVLPSSAKTKDILVEGPEIEAESAIVMDADSGAILYEKNMDKKEYPASITKIMTGMLAMENSSPEETVVFSHDAVFSIEPGSTHIGMRENEELTMEQSLHALLMASANEVANAISEHVGKGSKEQFIQMMNNRAKEIGCTNTNFQNPHGLYDDNHYTSAHDMALITKEALKLDQFREIISTYSYEIPKTNLIKEKRVFQNHHGMLPQCKYPYDGCIGGKTGFTSKSGHTLVTCAQRNGMTLICVIMKSDTVCYKDTKKLLDYGFSDFTKVTASEDRDARINSYKELLKSSKIKVKSSAPYLTLSENDYIILPSDYSEEDLKMEFLPETTDSKQENSVGQIKVTYKDLPAGSVSVIAASSKDTSIIKGILPKKEADKIKKPTLLKGGFSFTFSIILMLILLLLAVLICFYYNRRRR